MAKKSVHKLSSNKHRVSSGGENSEAFRLQQQITRALLGIVSIAIFMAFFLRK